MLFAGSTAGRAATSVAFTVASLAVKEMLDSTSWAGLATVAITVGTAVSASTLNGYMNRRGRNPGLALGYAVGLVGAVVATVWPAMEFDQAFQRATGGVGLSSCVSVAWSVNAFDPRLESACENELWPIPGLSCPNPGHGTRVADM